MAQWSVLEANGLHTTANPLSAVPKGAMRRAQNVVIRAKEVIEPRRGQKSLSYSLSAPYMRARELAYFPGGNDGAAAPIVHVDGEALWRDTGSAMAQFSGAYEAADADLLRMKFADSNNHLFFATSVGVQVLEEFSGTPRLAGIPVPTGLELTAAVAAGDDTEAEWLADDETVAVRVVFGRRDEETLVLGPPSERAVITNESGSTRVVTATVDIPEGLTTDYFMRIYMTEPVAIGTDPGEEFWLSQEDTLTAAQVAAGEVALEITAIEAVLSDVPLYTNPNTGGGIETSKRPPPFAKDICRWNKRLWAFNISRPHSLTLTILGMFGGTGGRGIYDNADHTIQVNGIYYTYNPSNDQTGDPVDASPESTILSSHRVRTTVYPSGTLSEQLADAAQQLALAINIVDPDLAARYVARPDGWPGEIVIERRDIGGEAFTAQAFPVNGDAGAGQAYFPNIVSAVSSLNSAQEHGFACSDIDEPESWPLFNYGTAGNKGSKILRGVPLRDGIFCFMSDGTIQVISGSAPPFRVDELDSTAKLYGPDTAQVLNNQIWALTSQGIVTVSNAGVGIIGLPIEVDVRALFGSALETTKLQAFGFAYETERTYFIALPERAGQANCSRLFGYNYATKAWAEWPLERTCGGVDPLTDMLYMGHPDAATLLVERKTLTADDFADEEVAITISAVSGTTITVDSTADASVGDVVEQGLVRAVVTAVTDATHLEVNMDADEETVPFAAGAATVYQGFECSIEYVPSALGAPGYSKNITDFGLLFWELACEKAEAWLSTDLSWTWARTKHLRRGGMGDGEWGSDYGDPSGPFVSRGVASSQKAEANIVVPRFTIREAFAQWKLLGFTLEYEVVSERTKP